MKISTFALMPHRELPADFEKRYQSVWVTPPWHELADARRVGEYYNWTIDELLYAAEMGSDGICTNEHHQNAYGFMPSPNLMGRVLARATNGTDVRHRADGLDAADDHPADPRRRGIRHARLHQRRPTGRRACPLGTPMDANLVLRCHAHRTARAIPRGARSDPEGVAVARGLRLERQVLPARAW